MVATSLMKFDSLLDYFVLKKYLKLVSNITYSGLLIIMILIYSPLRQRSVKHGGGALPPCGHMRTW